MTISIVVPAYNEARGLPATLASIRRAATAFDARGWAHEVIVCDNNSTDGTGEVARAAGATVVFEAVNQISRARNAGATVAAGEWLVFVDADSHPSPELFADAAEAMASGWYVAGGATVALAPGAGLLARTAVGLWNVVSRLGGLAAGSFIFCEARAFREVGGFSLALFATEELELFKRLKREAYATRRRIVILHEHPLRTSDRKARLYTKSEMARSLLKSMLTFGRTMRNRDDCYVWYDGRRE